MKIETLSTPFRKARLVNETSNGYRTIIPTITEPKGDAGTATGASIIELGTGGSDAQNALLIVPYSIGNDDTTYSVRVIGWRFLPKDSVGIGLWIPITLIELACTASTSVGIAGATVLSSERFADILTVTKGSTLVGEAPAENIISTTDNTISSAMVDLKGSQKVELAFTTGGSATSCNALVALL